jgi:hypothetical protein
MAADGHLTKQLLIRGAEDAGSGAASIRGEEEVVSVVDQHPGHPRETCQRAQKAACAAVENVDPIRACMCNVDPLMRVAVIVDISVVEL